MAALTTAERIDIAKYLLQDRWEEREHFLSDDDVLNATDDVAPLEDDDLDIYDVGTTDDVEAICRVIEHRVIAEELFDWLGESEDAPGA